MTDKGWYELHKHAVYDIYGLGNSLALKHTAIPLYKRMKAIWDYILDDSLSFWRTADYKGLTIGAQDYLGGVVESDRDAMKNSDIGASWMLASMTGDPRLTEERLPFMRNFKLMQQAPADDPNYGAAMGQYYLWKKKKFVEEWGDHIEPIGITYYTLMDLGNILLFERDDSLLRNSFQAGAERLLSLQQADGRVLPWHTANTTGNRCSPTCKTFAPRSTASSSPTNCSENGNTSMPRYGAPTGSSATPWTREPSPASRRRAFHQ